ncbi:MAG: HAD-IA family hydrolase [Candidatus Hodarchaeota archaeon]
MVEDEKVNKVLIIGGYNYLSLDQIQNKIKSFKTPYGQTSEFIIPSEKDPNVKNLIILNRHGLQHEISPSQINWRANFWAIKYILHIENIISYAAVGSLNKQFRPGDFVLLDDFVDFSLNRPSFSKNRASTKGVLHADLSTPFCPRLRKAILKAAEVLDIPLNKKGVYLCTEGPRFETPAEIKMFQNFADVIGMTIAKESTLAHELGLCYASIAIITNFGCGLTNDPVSYYEIVDLMKDKKDIVEKLILNTTKNINGSACKCQKNLQFSYFEIWPYSYSSIDNHHALNLSRNRHNGIIFDLCGTLYHSKSLSNAYKSKLVESISEKYKISKEQSKSLVSKYKSIYKNIYGYKPSTLKTAIDFSVKEQYQIKSILEVEPKNFLSTFPQLSRMLKDLSLNYRLAILTHSTKINTIKSIRALGINEKIFDSIIGSEKISEPKPELNCFMTVINDLGLPSNNCIFVGDRPEIDLYPAKELGLKTVLITNSKESSEHSQNIDIKIDSILNLSRIIDELDVFSNSVKEEVEYNYDN